MPQTSQTWSSYQSHLYEIISNNYKNPFNESLIFENLLETTSVVVYMPTGSGLYPAKGAHRDVFQ